MLFRVTRVCYVRTASRRYVGPREGASLTKTKTALDPDLAACLEDVHQGGGRLVLVKRCSNPDPLPRSHSRHNTTDKNNKNKYFLFLATCANAPPLMSIEKEKKTYASDPKPD